MATGRGKLLGPSIGLLLGPQVLNESALVAQLPEFLHLSGREAQSLAPTEMSITWCTEWTRSAKLGSTKYAT